MASNLEDLLAGGDSDDDVEEDVDVQGIDLEQLLDMKDDDEEGGIGGVRYSASSTSSLSGNQALFSSKLQDLFGAVPEAASSATVASTSDVPALVSPNFRSIRNQGQIDSDDDDDVMADEKKQLAALLEPDTPEPALEDLGAAAAAMMLENSLPNVITADTNVSIEEEHLPPVPPVAETRASFISIQTVIPTHMKECPTLKLAEVREQRALHYGERSAMSALQLRKSANTTSGSGPSSQIASLMMIDEMNSITKQLKRNGDYQQHGPGTATSITIGPKLVAIGTIKGYALIFDHKQEIRRVLNAPPPTRGTSMAVTSLDALAEGSMLITGHCSGDILFWDCAKQQVLRQMRDPSGGDVMKVYFLPNVGCLDYKCNYSLTDSESFHAIALTDNSVINRYKLSKSILTSWHMEVDCLLDGNNGRVVSVDVLGPVSEKLVANPVARYVASLSQVAEYSDIRNYPNICQYFAFSYFNQTHVVQVSPELKIVHKWDVTNAPPEDDQELSEVLQWTWLYLTAKEPVPVDPNQHHSAADQKKDNNVVGVWTPVIARARKNRIELMAMRIMIGSREPKPVAAATRRGSLLAFATGNFNVTEDLPSLKYDFQCIGNVTLDCGPITNMQWISASHVLVFTAKEMMLLDASLTVLEKTNLFPAIADACKISTNVLDIAPQFATYNKEVYILLSMAMYRMMVKSPFDQADAFITSGRWLEGLALIVENIHKSPSLLLYEEENIRKYILRYAALAVKRSLADSLPGNASSSSSSIAQARQANSAKNHFHLVASVCVEYCVATKNLPLLFYDILDIFRSENHQSTLLEALEPFIISRTITSLPPTVIADFLNAAVTADKMRTIERCVAYFDPLTLDINFVTKFLYDQKMFSTFLYVYAYGLADFPSAFQLVFQFIMSQKGMIDREGHWKNLDVLLLSQDEDGSHNSSSDGSNEITDLGYKLLLFLLYTFEDKVFPRGDIIAQSHEVIFGLLELLTSAHMLPLDGISQLSSLTSTFFHKHADLIAQMKYPMLMFFTKLDASALMFCLVKGIERMNRMIETTSSSSENGVNGGPAKQMIEFELAQLLYEIFSFSQLVDEEQEQDRLTLAYRFSMKDLFFQQFHAMISSLSCPLPSDLLQHMLVYSSMQPMQQHQHDELLYQQLVEKQSRYHHNANQIQQLQSLYHLLVQHHFYMAALHIKHYHHTTLSRDFLSPLKYYIDMAHRLMHREHRYEGWDAVFQYVSLQFQVFDQWTTLYSEQELDGIREQFRSNIITQLLDLSGIDLKQSVSLVINFLLPSFHEMVEITRSDPRGQFSLIKTLLEDWKVLHPDVNLASEYMTIPDVITYLRLIAKYETESFLPFFREYEEYCPVDDCLEVAKEFHISDAIAYLLEKTGDVQEALQILLKDISAKLRQGRREIDAQLRNEAKENVNNNNMPSSSKGWLTPLLPRSGRRSSVAKPSSTTTTTSSSSSEVYQLVEALVKLPGCKALRNLIDRTSDLCERQSQQLQLTTDQIEQLWFKTLDHLLEERYALRGGTISSSSEIIAQFLSHLLQNFMAKMKHVIAPQHIITRVVSHGARGSNSPVPSSNILLGNSNNNNNSIRLGELKDVLINMLDLTQYELLLNETVRNIFREDLRGVQGQRLSKMRAFAYRSNAEESQSSADANNSTSVATTESSSSSSSDTKPSDKYLEELIVTRGSRRMSVASRNFKVKDVKAYTSKSHEKSSYSQPRTSVPTNIADFSMDMDTRVPGTLDSSRAVYVTANIFQ